MKIALIGTHGVGKTTLAFDICSLLKKRGWNVEMVTEVARRCPLPVNEKTTLPAQLWILHSQIAAEIEAGHRAQHIICDRSVLDNYCYLVNRLGRQHPLEPWLVEWLGSYDRLVGVPLVREAIYAEEFRQPSLDDGFRATDRAFQQKIDALLKEMLIEPSFEAFATQVHWLDGVEQTEWAATVLAGLEPQLAQAAARGANH